MVTALAVPPWLAHRCAPARAPRWPDRPQAGAKIVDRPTALGADTVIKIRPPSVEEVPLLKSGGTLISLVHPARNTEVVDALQAHGSTTVAMDCIPRISRAQVFDVLSSMANIAGYRAIVEAMNEFGRFFGGQITAAGRIPPAKVLVVGGGVAGLSAIGAAKNMGAVVRCFDTRPEVRRQPCYSAPPARPNTPLPPHPHPLRPGQGAGGVFRRRVYRGGG